MARAASPSLMRSSAVDTVCGLYPLTSAKWVWVIPSVVASALSREMKVAWEPATHTARVSAMLFAEGRSRASSSCRSLNCSPTVTGRLDPSSAITCS